MLVERIFGHSSRLAHDRRGVAAVELALLSPLLILLFFGTLEVTQLIRVEAKLAHSAQVIQDIVAGQTPPETTSYFQIAFNAGQLVMTPFNSTSLTATIVGVDYDGKGNGTVSWQQAENNDPGLAVSTACTLASGMSLTNDSVVVVQATYTYHPIISYLFGKQFTLTQTAFGRPRNSPSITDNSSSNGPTGSC